MVVLESLDGNVSYGPSRRRGELASCSELYRGNRCSTKDLEKDEEKEGQAFFGIKKDAVSMDEVLEVLKKQGEELQALRKDLTRKTGILSQRVSMQHARLEVLDEAFGTYLELGTTPHVIIVDRVWMLKKMADEEYHATLQYVMNTASEYPAVKAAVAEANAVVKSLGEEGKSSLKKLQFDEFCHAFAGRESELAMFMYDTVMTILDAPTVGMAEWNHFHNALLERHKFGHPACKQDSTDEEEARIERVRSLYSSYVERNTFCVARFPGLAKRAESLFSAESGFVDINVVSLDEELAFTSFCSKMKRFWSLSREDMALADYALVKTLDEETSRNLSSYGVHVVLVVVNDSQKEEGWKLVELRKKYKLSVSRTSELNLNATLERSMAPFRYSTGRGFRMPVMSVQAVSQDEVRVTGRVDRGNIRAGMMIVADDFAHLEQEAARWPWNRSRLVVVSGQGSSGQVVEVTLKGILAKRVIRGNVLSDFRDPLNGVYSLVARVVATHYFGDGSYELLCHTASYKVSVEILGGKLAPNKNVDGDRDDEILGDKKADGDKDDDVEMDVNIVSTVPMALIKSKSGINPNVCNDHWTFGLSRFLLRNEDKKMVAAGVVSSVKDQPLPLHSGQLLAEDSCMVSASA